MSPHRQGDLDAEWDQSRFGMLEHQVIHIYVAYAEAMHLRRRERVAQHQQQDERDRWATVRFQQHRAIVVGQSSRGVRDETGRLERFCRVSDDQPGRQQLADEATYRDGADANRVASALSLRQPCADGVIGQQIGAGC